MTRCAMGGTIWRQRAAKTGRAALWRINEGGNPMHRRAFIAALGGAAAASGPWPGPARAQRSRALARPNTSRSLRDVGSREELDPTYATADEVIEWGR